MTAAAYFGGKKRPP